MKWFFKLLKSEATRQTSSPRPNPCDCGWVRPVVLLPKASVKQAPSLELGDPGPHSCEDCHWFVNWNKPYHCLDWFPRLQNEVWLNNYLGLNFFLFFLSLSLTHFSPFFPLLQSLLLPKIILISSRGISLFNVCGPDGNIIPHALLLQKPNNRIHVVLY